MAYSIAEEAGHNHMILQLSPSTSRACARLHRKCCTKVVNCDRNFVGVPLMKTHANRDLRRKRPKLSVQRDRPLKFYFWKLKNDFEHLVLCWRRMSVIEKSGPEDHLRLGSPHSSTRHASENSRRSVSSLPRARAVVLNLKFNTTLGKLESISFIYIVAKLDHNVV